MKYFLRIPRGLWLALGIYTLIFVVLDIFKYLHFGYTGQDLGIFDQVLWNIAHGKWFWYSFANYSYLVDHREWMLLALAPLYWIVPHPITLLIVQTLVIASGAIPLYYIARHVLRNFSPLWSLGMSIFYLANPGIHSMNLYEFHMYPFVIPLTLWWWWSVEKGKLLRAVVLFIMILLVRDDAALMTAGAGLILMLFPRAGFAQKPQRLVGIIMTVTSVTWLLGMEKLGMSFSPYNVPKYFAYYDWAGSTTQDVIYTIITQPLKTLQMMISNDHLSTIAILFAGVGFLALLGVQYMIPSIGIFLLYLLTDEKIASALLTMHHASPFIPWLFIASCYGLRRLVFAVRKHMQSPGAFPFDALAISALIGIFLFQIFLMSPWRVAHSIISSENVVNIQEMRETITNVSDDAKILTTARFYPYLAHRQYIYPLQHLWFGKEHLMKTDYTPPTNIEWMLIEQDEVLNFVSVLSRDSIDGIPQRLAGVIDDNHLKLTHAGESVFVYQRDAENVAPEAPLRTDDHALQNILRIPVSSNIELQGWGKNGDTLRLQFQRTGEKQEEEKELHYELTWYDKNGTKLKTRRFLIGAGLSPTTTWPVRESKIVTQNIETPRDATRLELTVGNVIPYSNAHIIETLKTTINPRTSVTVTLTTDL